MGPVAITARFPLGVYHGHGDDGAPDPWPSPARLFSALVSAACTGTTATPEGAPSHEAEAALRWLEEHPPSGLRIPPTMAVRTSHRMRVAYCDTGVVETNQSTKKKEIKKKSKPISDGVAVAGGFAWIWDEMPTAVQEALTGLCADIPHLGEADSVAVFEVDTGVEPTWRIDEQATAFTPGGLRLPVPAPGRAEVLADLHAKTRPAKWPTASADKPKASESVVVLPTSTECLRTVRYVAAGFDDGREAADGFGSPWNEVLVLLAGDGSGQEFSALRRLDWCVGFHKALISRIGYGAPAVVTGRYPEGLKLPANRLAIQYVPASVFARSRIGRDASGAPGAFLVMLPADISAPEAKVVRQGLDGMRHVTSRWGKARLRPLGKGYRAGDFWAAPASGTTRLWSPTPVAVPEVVRQRGQWTFEDAILLSLGFVWRDALEPVGKGPQGYRDLVQQVRALGASAMWYERVTKRATAYAHKMPQGMVAQPYHALIHTGALLPDSALAAVGQSRHLGGGLLVPADLPTELVQATLRSRRVEP